MRKIQLLTVALCSILMIGNAHAKINTPSRSSVVPDTLVIKDASLFCDVNLPIHGIAFDSEGLMYVGAHKNIYTMTPGKEVKNFITLHEPTENTMIWSLRFGPDRCLYVAAKDRIAKVSPQGEQEIIIKEHFSGPCGVSDLRFDHHGNLFVAYDNMVAKYDSNYHKEIVIDGSQFDPPMEWIVGIEFSRDFKKMYLGDCRGKQAYILPYLSGNDMKESRSFPTNWGQYFARDHKGNVYLSSLGFDPNLPEFVMFTSENERIDLYCKQRVPQSRGNHKKAIAWGQKGFNESALYCIIGNRIYEYELSKVSSGRKRSVQK